MVAQCHRQIVSYEGLMEVPSIYCGRCNKVDVSLQIFIRTLKKIVLLSYTYLSTAISTDGASNSVVSSATESITAEE